MKKIITILIVITLSILLTGCKKAPKETIPFTVQKLEVNNENMNTKEEVISMINSMKSSLEATYATDINAAKIVASNSAKLFAPDLEILKADVSSYYIYNIKSYITGKNTNSLIIKFNTILNFVNHDSFSEGEGNSYNGDIVDFIVNDNSLVYRIYTLENNILKKESEISIIVKETHFEYSTYDYYSETVYYTYFDSSKGYYSYSYSDNQDNFTMNKIDFNSGISEALSIKNRTETLQFKHANYNNNTSYSIRTTPDLGTRVTVSYITNNVITESYEALVLESKSVYTFISSLPLLDGWEKVDGNSLVDSNGDVVSFSRKPYDIITNTYSLYSAFSLDGKLTDENLSDLENGISYTGTKKASDFSESLDEVLELKDDFEVVHAEGSALYKYKFFDEVYTAKELVENILTGIDTKYTEAIEIINPTD